MNSTNKYIVERNMCVPVQPTCRICGRAGAREPDAIFSMPVGLPPRTSSSPADKQIFQYLTVCVPGTDLVASRRPPIAANQPLMQFPPQKQAPAAVKHGLVRNSGDICPSYIVERTRSQPPPGARFLDKPDRLW